MKTKQILILAVILALLIAGILLKKSQHRPELATEEYAPLAMSFDGDQISKVVLFKQAAGFSKENPQVALVKEKGVWKIPGLWGARADQEKITSFFSEVKKAKGELRGKTKEAFKDFGISDEEGFYVSFADASGKEALGFVIGTKKADYGTLFVRKKDSEAVYLTEAGFYAGMGVFGNPEKETPGPDFWVLKKYASFDTGTVKKTEVFHFEDGVQVPSIVLEKTDGRWRFGGAEFPFPPSAEKISQYLNGIKNMPADKILDPQGKDYGFERPRWQIRVTQETGDFAEFTVGNSDTKQEDTFYLQASGEPAVFLVSKYAVENMTAEAAWFVGDNPLGIDNTKVEKLAIHADKIEKNFQPLVKKWDALTSYLDGLKNFKIEKAVGGKPRFGKYRIEIKRQGDAQSVIIDVADAPVTLGEQKFYPAQKQGNSTLFSITAVLFSQLFDNLSRLDEPTS